MQAPSVYTAISSDRGVGPRCLYHHVILLEYLSGSVKIRKHSARLSLQVIDGLKVISPSHCLALSFLSFRVLVRDIPSSGSCFVGLCFGGMRFILARASVVHLCGLLHPMFQSLAHSRHRQFLFFQWVGCWTGWRCLADVLIRSATVTTSCFCRRHFAFVLFIGFCSVERWYHAGSCARR